MGDRLYRTDREYYYYHENTDSILFYTKTKDSVLTDRRIIHKQKGRIVKIEFFENLSMKSYKPIYSCITAKYVKKGKDSTIYETVKLHTGDSLLRTAVFKDKKISYTQELKNGKLNKQASYTYNEKGLLVSKKTSDALWGTSSTEDFEYENRHKSKSTEIITEKGGNQRTIYYTYDEKGNETSLESDIYIGKYKNEMASESVKTEYTYKNGLVTEETKVSKGIHTTKISYEYTFY